MSLILAIVGSLSFNPVQISDYTSTGVAQTPATAQAGYTLGSSGDVFDTADFSLLDVGDWLSPKTGMSGYEARATVQSGSLSSGTAGSWINLGLGAAWTRTQSSLGTSTCVLLVEIRNATTLVVLDSATITMSATQQVDPP